MPKWISSASTSRRYRARWETNRAREKAGGKAAGQSSEPARSGSANRSWQPEKSEYKTLLETRLGLNFEQFTRAVMLAQSEFSAFLKADDKERSELLEKLTDTAIYSQLGRRAYGKSKEAEEALKTLNAQAGNLTPLEPEQRAELELRFADAQQQLKLAQAQLRQLELKQQWLSELNRLRDSHLAASEQLASAQQTLDNQNADRQQLGQLERLAPQRHQFAAQDRTHRSQLTPVGGAD
jgi:exonuclease SbcC